MGEGIGIFLPPPSPMFLNGNALTLDHTDQTLRAMLSFGMQNYFFLFFLLFNGNNRTSKQNYSPHKIISNKLIPKRMQ